VAAAAGHIDGVAVVVGMLFGIVVFNGVFDWIAAFYETTSLGPITLTDLAGVSRGTGVAILTGVALTGFAVVARIERSRS
jgi:hypothetical protein